MPAHLSFMQKYRMTKAYPHQFIPQRFFSEFGAADAVRSHGRKNDPDEGTFKFAGSTFTKYSSWLGQAESLNGRRRETLLESYNEYRDYMDNQYRSSPGYFGPKSADEWDLYLKPGTVFDQRVRDCVDTHGGSVMLIVFYKGYKSDRHLKRIEAFEKGDDDSKHPEIIWSLA
jgi:hypothetical protein